MSGKCYFNHRDNDNDDELHPLVLAAIGANGRVDSDTEIVHEIDNADNESNLVEVTSRKFRYDLFGFVVCKAN